jgi:two-component system, response regulator YesN
MTLRIVVADDNSRILKAIVAELQAAPFDVIGTVSNGRSALECVEWSQPHVMVLDLVMPALKGIEVTWELRKSGPAPAVVICSVETDLQTIDAAREAGALGYVFKYRTAKDLVQAVHAASRDEVFISPE